jgi:PEGA domain
MLPMKISRLLSVGCLLTALPGLSAAHAAGPDDEAEAAVKRGIEFRRRGDDHRALEEFQKADRLKSSARVTGQIGLAQMALGHWVEASDALDSALASRDDAWIKKNRGSLQDAARAVSRHVCVIEVEGEPAGASVALNGSVAGTLPLKSKVVAGDVVILVTAPGHVSLMRKVTVEPDTKIRESFTLTAVLSSAPPRDVAAAVTPVQPELAREAGPPPSAPVAGSQRRFGQLPWWTAGAAAAGLGAGVTLRLLAQSQLSSFNASCGLVSGTPVHDPASGPTTTDAQCADHLSSWSDDKSRATVAFIAGGVLAAGSVVLFLLNSEPHDGARASVAYQCLPDGPGILCAARF